MKNMETIRATMSTFPKATVTIAMPAVTRVAFRGSLPGPAPSANTEFAPFTGKMASPANAWRVRGATRMEPMADERVAAPRPMGMIGPQRAILDMTSWSEARSSGGAETAIFTTTAT